jgi:hypothetical protein
MWPKISPSDGRRHGTANHYRRSREAEGQADKVRDGFPTRLAVAGDNSEFGNALCCFFGVISLRRTVVPMVRHHEPVPEKR